MKNYEKPIMIIERYIAEDAVASGCYLTATTSFPSQTVDCVINGKETIFAQAGMSGCETSVSNSQLLKDGSGNYYYMWEGEIILEPTAEQENNLNSLAKKLGVYNTVNQGGYHIGKVSWETYKSINSGS